jgi:hypothetical protein
VLQLAPVLGNQLLLLLLLEVIQLAPAVAEESLAVLGESDGQTPSTETSVSSVGHISSTTTTEIPRPQFRSAMSAM